MDYKGVQYSGKDGALKKSNSLRGHLCFLPWLSPKLGWHFRNLLNNEDGDKVSFWLLLYHVCNIAECRRVSDLHRSRLDCQFSMQTNSIVRNHWLLTTSLLHHYPSLLKNFCSLCAKTFQLVCVCCRHFQKAGGYFDKAISNICGDSSRQWARVDSIKRWHRSKPLWLLVILSAFSVASFRREWYSRRKTFSLSKNSSTSFCVELSRISSVVLEKTRNIVSNFSFLFLPRTDSWIKKNQIKWMSWWLSDWCQLFV